MIFPLLDGHFRGNSCCHDPSIWSQSCETAPTAYSSKLFSQQSSVDPNYANYYVDGDPKLPKVTTIYNNHSNLDYVCNLSIETHGDLGSPMTYETPKLKFPQRFEHPNASLRARPTFSTVCTALASRSPVNK